MGIDRTGPIGPSRPAADPSVRDPARPESTPQSPPIRLVREDSVELSDQARVLSEVPDDEREALVKQLQQQVSSGTYEVDAERIARQMVDRGDA
ncbi:MAG: flagellar biosynthesis anti-sigma factor FlgM [Dehalococcoidia bacterium]